MTPPKITLKLPAEEPKEAKEPKAKRARLDVQGIPDEYEVVLPPSHTVKNTFVFSEKERTWVAQPGEESSSARRKREKGEYHIAPNEPDRESLR